MNDKKNNRSLIFDGDGEEIVRRQLMESYHSGVVDGYLEEYSEEITEDLPDTDQDPKE